jgi:hypothetical protein
MARVWFFSGYMPSNQRFFKMFSFYWMTYPLVKKSEILKNDLILKYKDFSEWSNFYG